MDSAGMSRSPLVASVPVGGSQPPSARAGSPLSRVRLRRVQRVMPMSVEQAALGMNTLVLHGFIFQTVFVRLAVAYMRVFSSGVRRLFESLALSAAVLMLGTMLYTQYALESVSEQCLDELGRDLPAHGVLRLEVVRGAPANYTLNMSYAKEEAAWHRYRDDSLLRLIDNFLESTNRPAGAVDSRVDQFTTSSHCSRPLNIFEQYRPEELSKKYMCSAGSRGDEAGTAGGGGDESRILTDTENGLSWFSWSDFADTPWLLYDDYIVEFALDSGLLRLSRHLRQRFSVPVHLHVLDPDRHPCFGDRLTRLVLSNVVGYDDIMLESLKQLSERRLNSAGFLRNVITGDHYRFVSNWSVSTSLLSAAVMMFVFTLTVTMLLRYCHQQIYTFLLTVLRMGGDGGAPVTATAAARLLAVPTASLMTIVLALVGLVTWMTEFFNYSTISFHVIFIVWLVDQFDTFCCHSQITRKHFLRFFYLYHFCFYMHQYCSSGQFAGMALATSWLFTQHAMLYFLHHYELPMIDRNIGLRRLVQDAIHQENQRMSEPSANQQENQRIPADQQENQQMSTDQLANQHMSADHQENQRIPADQQENQQMSANHQDNQQMSTDQLENQHMSADHQENQRISADQQENQRISADQQENQRISADQQENQRISADQQENQRMSADQRENQRISEPSGDQQENQRLACSPTEQDSERSSHEVFSDSTLSMPEYSDSASSAPVHSEVNTMSLPLGSSGGSWMDGTLSRVDESASTVSERSYQELSETI